MTMIQASLKRLHSPDVDDLESFVPEDPNRFGILVQAMFGPEGLEGEESFDLLVCTPAWMAEEVKHAGIVIGRHYLIVNTFDLPGLRAFLEDYAKSSPGKTWQEVTTKLARLGRWEFEDYVPQA